jgi:hypothetical protein
MSLLSHQICIKVSSVECSHTIGACLEETYGQYSADVPAATKQNSTHPPPLTPSNQLPEPASQSQPWDHLDCPCDKYCGMSSSLVKLAPGIVSLMTTDAIAFVAKKERARLNACIAIPRSAGWESWFGFTIGRSRVELEVMLVQPRGVRRALRGDGDGFRSVC